MVGRSIEALAGEPKYLGLPARKPLLGWESACGSRTVFVVEGPFDWLTLQSWEFPALALVGTHVRPAVLTSLTRFERIYLVLDNDDAGRAATATITTALGNRAVPVPLSDAKDVSDLAVRVDGYSAFVQAVHEAESPARPTLATLAA
jgi:DNA primase